MAGRKRSNEQHHPAEQETKRSERIETGHSGTHPFHYSREAQQDAGTPNRSPHPASDIDDVDASKSLGLLEAAARDRGEEPTTPYSRGQA